MNTFEKLKAEAEKIGFKFELQKWVPDDYEEDEDGKQHLVTGEVSAWKVTFPADWPRPAHWVQVGDDLEMSKSLAGAMKEYDGRFEIARQNVEISKQSRDAVNRLGDMLKERKA